MTLEQIEAKWRIWNVGGRWYARNPETDQIKKAGTRYALLQTLGYQP